MTRAEEARLRAIVRRLKPVDRRAYPELFGRDLGQIYEGKMGPGGLYLAAEMLRGLAAAREMRVLDLGCGRGATSVFIAERLEAQVICADLWISAAERLALIEAHDAQSRVTPLDIDVRRPLPFADNYFDVIFCMDAFHYFGARRSVVARLARCLKPSGRLVVGNPCFDREVVRPVPQVYAGPWAEEFSKYHSPPWWARRLRDFGLFSSVEAREALDGRALWEDALLYDLEGRAEPGHLLADAKEIVFGRDHPDEPTLTHYILRATKPGKLSARSIADETGLGLR
jgi:SAM-dependent methyltransferase